MKIHYSVRHIKLTPSIRQYVESKIAPLGRIDERHALGAHVVLFYDETHGSEPYHVKVHVAVPGNDLHAEARADDLYKAIDLVEDKVQMLLLKEKTKAKSKRIRARIKHRISIRGKK